jgi:hypothetical protein
MRLPGTLTALALALLVSGITACTYKPRTAPPNTGAGTVNQARQFLQGRWSLVSFTAYPPSGAPVEVKGSGALVYDDFSNLSMTVTTDDASAALMTKAGIPMEKNRLAIDGKVIVDMQNRTLRYVLEGQHIGVTTGPMALDRLRHWQVDGTTLTLTTLDDRGKPLSVAKWQKQ